VLLVIAVVWLKEVDSARSGSVGAGVGLQQLKTSTSLAPSGASMV
jgi:hypothetical protein